MGIGYDITQGIKKSFTETPKRREEKNQRAYKISQEEIEQKLSLKGKIVWIKFDKNNKTAQITTEE
jgi:hypothetical protein